MELGFITGLKISYHYCPTNVGLSPPGEDFILKPHAEAWGYRMRASIGFQPKPQYFSWTIMISY